MKIVTWGEDILVFKICSGFLSKFQSFLPLKLNADFSQLNTFSLGKNETLSSQHGIEEKIKW